MFEHAVSRSNRILLAATGFVAVAVGIYALLLLKPAGPALVAFVEDSAARARTAADNPAAPEPPAGRPASARAPAGPTPPEKEPRNRPSADASSVGPPLPPPTGEIFGRVVDPQGTPVPEAFVELGVERTDLDEDGDDPEALFESSASARTDPQGSYSIEPRARGAAIVHVRAERFEPAAREVYVPDGTTRQRIDFQLVPLPVSVIRGRLVTPQGDPLPPYAVVTLFPGATGRRREDLWGSSWIYALTEPFCPGMWGERIPGESATIRSEDASFEIVVPRGAERLVTATFRDSLLAERPWRDGDAEIELAIDFRSVLHSLGSATVKVLDGSSGAPVPSPTATLRARRGDLRMQETRPGWSGEIPFPPVPEGPYLLEVGAAGFATSVRTIRIRAQEVLREVVSLEKAATLRVRFIPEVPWDPRSILGRVEYRTRAGIRLCRVEVSTAEVGREVVLPELPPGPGFVVAVGSALPVILAGERETVVEFPLREPRRLKIRFRPRSDLLGSDGSFECGYGLLSPTGMPLLEGKRRLRPKRDRLCSLTLRAPPGEYALELQVCRGKGILREVTVGEGAATEILVESP